jgi:hypothetical protein
MQAVARTSRTVLVLPPMQPEMALFKSADCAMDWSKF